MAGLRGRQREFVNQYFILRYNGTRAAEAAGYVGNDATLAVTAHRLLRTAKVKAEIDRRLDEKAMPADEVLARLGEIAGGNIADFIDDSGGIDFEKVKANGHLVKKVVHQKGQRATIELHDSLATLMHLDKHHGGANKGPIPHRLEVDDARLTDEDRIDRLAALLDAARARRDRRDPVDIGVAAVDASTGSTD